MEELFRWQKAIDTEDENFMPKDLQEEGSIFNIVRIRDQDPTDIVVGMTAILRENDGSCDPYFTIGKRLYHSMFWYQLTPIIKDK